MLTKGVDLVVPERRAESGRVLRLLNNCLCLKQHIQRCSVKWKNEGNIETRKALNFRRHSIFTPPLPIAAGT